MRIGEEVRRLEGTLMLADPPTPPTPPIPPTPAAGGQGGPAVRLARGAVEIEGGRIARVEVEESRELDLRRVICPGFIDAHLHVPQFDSIGHDGVTLLDWLNGVIFPAEARWADAGYARRMGERVARRLLSHGTTGVCAYGTVHHEGTRAAMEAMAATGIRGYMGQVLMDQQGPGELLRPAGRLLEEASRLERVGRMEPVVSPRFAVSCSMELMRGAGELARERGWLVQTHLAEMRPECELVRRLHGMGYVEVYREAGLLGKRSVLAHAVWMSEDEWREVERAGCVVAHCPTANRFLSSGRFSRQGYPRLALGSDVAGGPDVSMVRVARAAREVWLEGCGAGERAAFSPARWWWQITAGNADALGMGDAGRLRAGAAADLVVIEPEVELREGGGAALGQMMYGWDERWVRGVVVEGRWRMANSK